MLNLSGLYGSEGMKLTCSVKCLVLGLSLDVLGVDTQADVPQCLPHPGSGPGSCRDS